MGFLTYKKTTTGSTVRYERLKPLKLGGRDGLIAKHVATLTDAESRSWRLGADALLKLADGDTATGTVVLFDVAGGDATNVCLYELTRIHGSCRDTSTQLALDFTVLVDREIGDDAAGYAKAFETALPEPPRLLGEMLALTGGPSGGDWKWSGSATNLGMTIVQAR